jgi:hypothetical protein
MSSTMSVLQTEPTPQIRQLLFIGDGGPGRRFAFAFLEDGRCAVLCNGHIERACDGDDAGVVEALDHFCHLTSFVPSHIAPREGHAA